MLVTYGGVSLNLITVKEFNRQAVYLGRNYAYTRFRLGVRAWLNPSTQRDTYAGETPITGPGATLLTPAPIPGIRSGPIAPPILTGTAGPVTGPPFISTVRPSAADRALRHLLLTPRLSLQFSFLGSPSLQSPLPGFTCDCIGGPTPVECAVTELNPRCWLVEWTVETAVNETYFYAGTAALPLVLAQQFRVTHDIGADFFTTRRIRGQILFRQDALQSLGRSPDDYRAQILVPPPFQFKREKIQVWGDEDNPALLHFDITDRQLPFGWFNTTITRLSATHSIHVTKAPLGEVFRKNMVPVLKGMVRQGRASISFGESLLSLSPSKAADSLAHAADAMLDTQHAATSMVLDALPVAKHSIEIECWGSPQSTRSDMEIFARNVAFARMSNFFLFSPALTSALPLGAAVMTAPLLQAANVAGASIVTEVVGKLVNAANGIVQGAFAAFTPYGVDTLIEHDIVNKHIRFVYTAITGPISTLWKGASAVLNTSPMPDNMENTSLDGIVLIGSQLGVPAPPFSDGTRGTFLENVVAAALQPFNSLPLDIPAGRSRLTVGPVEDDDPPLPLTI